MRGCSFKLLNSNFKLPSPLSCRWRSDQHPCCPSLTIGGIRDRRLHFCTLLTDQQPRMRLAAGNVRNRGRHAAAMAFVPELDAELSPPVQREGMLIQSRNIDVSSSSNGRPSLSIRWIHHCRRLFSTCFLVASPCENSKQDLTPT